MAEAVKEEVKSVRPDYEEKILQILQTPSSPFILAKKLDDFHEQDIAETLDDLTPDQLERLFNNLSADRLADIFEYLELDQLVQYVSQIDIRKVVDIFNRLETDVTAEVLPKVNADRRALIMFMLKPEILQKFSIITSFGQDEIGSHMTANFIEVSKDLTADQAFNEVIKQAPNAENITTIYVSDDLHQYYGAVTLKDLITSKGDLKLEEIVSTSYPYLYANESLDQAIDRLRDYNEDSIPILNTANILMGVITTQDLLEVMDDEMGEDYAMLAGLTAEEDLEESLFQSLRKRLPWLVTLLILGLLVSGVVSLFEGVVAELTIIMAFQSLILGMAGNVGTQSLAVTIRVLVDENISGTQKRDLVKKEVKIGFVNGMITGTASFLVLGAYIWLFKHYPINSAFAISACIGSALWVAMLISSLTGVSIPLFFKKIHVDPAVASGPLITTINDLVGVVTYYGLAWIFLIQLLGL